MRSTLAKVGPAARRVGLSPVSIHVDTPLVTGNWDANRLRQAVSNLMGNAVQHGSDTAPVELRLRGRG